MNNYDVIVIGLGAMGSATVYQIAKAGGKVLGIDQFSPPHSYGSSHGQTRITRQAIAEGKEYVPLVLRANELWRELETETNTRLLQQAGILIMASDTFDTPNKFVENTIAAAKQYGIKHTELSAAAIKDRFPQFNIHGNEKGYFEDGAGFLYAEACISAQLERAQYYGAALRTGETFLNYKQTANGIIVKTNKSEYVTSKLVLTMGPWVRDILPDNYKQSIQIYRQVLYWFKLRDNAEQYKVGKFPVFNWKFSTAHDDFIYGFPSLDGRSIKIATKQYIATTDPNSVNRQVDAAEIKKMYQQCIAPYLPDVSETCLRAEACLYSVAPGWRFLIDYHPDNKNIVIASPCSGHGFKHSAAIGEVISYMVTEQKPKVDISNFSFGSIGKTTAIA